MKKYLDYSWAAVLVCFLTLVYFFNKRNTEALAQHGIVIKAVIAGQSDTRSTTTLVVKFHYQGRLVQNECRTTTGPYQIGDSIRVKILPEDPEGPCVLQL